MKITGSFLAARVLGLALLFALLGAPRSEGRAYKPNIILMLADDFGYGSINAYGAPEKYVKTPNLDALVNEGVKFTQAYTSGSVCTPTRYGIVTGEYSWRGALKTGVVNNSDGLIIDPDTETVASFLRKQGYQTAIVGKWHLGYTAEKQFENLLGTIKPGPNDVGFNYQFAVPNNLDDLHKVWIENDHIYGLRSDKIEAYGKSSYGRPYIGYDAPQRVCVEVMSECTQRSIDWIDSLPKDTPFFLYHAFPAVHNPISPSDAMKGKSGCGDYGDFIQDVDLEVGNLVAALKQRGLDENTLIIFTADNGGDLPKRDAPAKTAYDKGFEFNGENRGDKHLIYNGGSHVPFIVNWPAKVKPKGECDALVCTVDIFGTLAHLVTGDEIAAQDGARDSVSFLPLIAKPTGPETRANFISRDVAGRKYVRFGDWKYIDNQFPKSRNDPETLITKGQPELYNIAKDPMEEKNLFKSNPEMAEQGVSLLQKIIEADSSRALSRTR